MAANSILKLKVDNTEYDANIKKAAEGIQHLAKRMHDAQGDFEGLDKASLDFIKDLQYMTTSAKTASGQYRELENAYKNLAATYEGLSAFEKEGDAGKALAEQLEILKNRTLDMKANMDAASKSLNDNGQSAEQSGGILESLASKFTLNIDALKLFDMGLSATKAALDVAKDAFFNNEEQLDEWGRVVESSHSLYTGFLNALNTGDISGYLNNINQIVQAARDAYDALDNLSTYNAFNQINVERTRTNMTESIADYRGGKGSKDTVKAAGEAYKKELQERKRLENDAYLAAVKRVAAERGVSAKDLTDALSGTYGHYQDLKNVQPTGVRQTVVGAGMYARTSTEKFAQTRQEKLGEALRHLNDTELQSLQALGAQAQRTGTEIAQVDKQLTRVLNGKQPGASGGSGSGTKNEPPALEGSIDAQTKKVQDLQKAWRAAADDDSRQKIKAQLDEAQRTLDTMTGKVKLPDPVIPGSLKAYQEQLKESQSDLQVMREDLLRLKEAGAEPMEIAVKEDEIHDAIDNISTIEKKIDELNGKSANISINIGDEAGSFDIGESMMEKLRDEIAASAENADMSTITEFIKQGIENGVDSADMTSIGQKLIQRMTNGDDIDPSDMEDFLATMKEKLQGIIDEEEWPKIEIAVKTGDLTAIQEFTKRVQVASKTAEDGWKHAASAISTLGSALNQIEDPMAKVVGTIAMAVAQVAEAAGKAINAKDTTSSGWAWIGAAAAITATMVSTIATIHSATKFADGGIVPGSTMSGDQIPALLNSQEVVLNHAQVGNLAAQLEGGSSQGGQPNVRIEGEDLWITLNNYTQRSGYGEIVTSK